MAAPQNTTHKHPTYEHYKPSGIDWLGDIPAHWEVINLGHLAKIQTGDKDTENKVDDGEYPFFVRSNTIERINTYSYDGEAVLTAGDGVGVGKVFHHYIGKFDYHQRVYSFTKFRHLKSKFFYYYFSHFFDLQMNLNSAKSTVDSVRLPFLKYFPISVPPLAEQQAIAAWLDEQTAKLDDLIARKKRVLELLAEKRAALITHAVTKGLNPNAPTKPSGIHWLGDIPAHWEVKNFKYCIFFQEGPGIMSVDFQNEGIPLIRITGVKNKEVTLDGCNFLSPTKVKQVWEHFKLKKDDLLISCSASTGIVSRVSNEAIGAIPYTGLITLRPLENITLQFIEWLVQSNLYSEQIELLKTGSTIQHYGPSHLKQIFITLPPLQEQQAIAAWLDAQTAQLDATRDRITQAINLLTEYRASLITHAVTGKIKVPGVTQPASSTKQHQPALA